LFLQPLALGHIGERDAHSQRAAAIILQRRCLHIVILDAPIWHVALHTVKPDRAPLGINLFDEGAQLYRPVRDFQVLAG
jgi:hypothetical protein